MVRWCLGLWSAPPPRRGACTPAPRAADHPIRAMPRGPAAETIGRMSDPTFQTVRLRRGAHASPEHGACVVELASMLAEERFSDHPRSVCRVIAGFLRVYNDRLPPSELDEIRPLAAMVVGSAASWSVRRRRRPRGVVGPSSTAAPPGLLDAGGGPAPPHRPLPGPRGGRRRGGAHRRRTR